MKSLLLILLVVASLSGTICVTIQELADQNELLAATVKRLEKKLEDLVQTVRDCKSPSRRQSYEGPVAFTYKLIPKATYVVRDKAIVFPTRVTDLGSGYDNSTGIYTAPQPGVYMISCSLLADHDMNSNPMLHASIIVDGMKMANVFAYSESGTHRDQGANTILVNLKKGSQVWIQVKDSAHVTIGGEHYSTFSGYLLWQL